MLWRGAEIGNRCFDRKLGGLSIFGDRRVNKRSHEHDGAGLLQKDMVPDADVAAGNRGHPVPSEAGDERGRILAEDSAVVGSHDSQVIQRSGMSDLVNQKCNGIGLPGQNLAGDVELPTRKRAVDVPDRRGVEKDVGFPVDPIDIEKQVLICSQGGRDELFAVPEIVLERLVGNQPDLIPKVRIGNQTIAQIIRQHCSGHLRLMPIGDRER